MPNPLKNYATHVYEKEEEMDKNRRLVELLNGCWHEVEREGDSFCEHCEEHYTHVQNPDFAADPRLVLRAMERIGKLDIFLQYLCPEERCDLAVIHFVRKYMLDTTGKLRDAAIEFLEDE